MAFRAGMVMHWLWGCRRSPRNVLKKWRHLQLPGNDEEGVIEKLEGVFYKKGTDAWKAAKAVQAKTANR